MQVSKKELSILSSSSSHTPSICPNRLVRLATWGILLQRAPTVAALGNLRSSERPTQQIDACL
eukprot:3668184-Amphidinium_carterae.1